MPRLWSLRQSATSFGDSGYRLESLSRQPRRTEAEHERHAQLGRTGRGVFFTKALACEEPILVFPSRRGRAHEFDGLERIGYTASEPMRIIALGPSHQRQHGSGRIRRRALLALR